jgi:hypothetical protein
LDPAEGLIRRARRGDRRQMYVHDQITGKLRPPAAAFEPRLPENRPAAKRHDKYLSVNISSSLANARESVDWGCDHRQFYAARLSAVACHSLALGVTWEPIVNSPNPGDDNPHHGGIHGVVELYRLDRDSYDLVITKLAKASEVLPECLAPHATTPLPWSGAFTSPEARKGFVGLYGTAYVVLSSRVHHSIREGRPMPFRFRRSIRIAPGVQFGLSRRGVSTCVGGRAGHVTVGTGGVKATTTAPGIAQWASGGFS